jgi:hypothetical protein
MTAPAVATKQPLHVVTADSERERALNEARSAYARALCERQRVHGALQKAKLDADTNVFSKRAAAAYMAGNTDIATTDGDLAKARAASAAIPELRRALKQALDGELHARGRLRVAIGAIATQRYEQAARRYSQAALQMGDAWRDVIAAHHTVTAAAGRADPLPEAAVQVAAVALAVVGREFPTTEAWSTQYLVAPDPLAHRDAGAQRSFAQQRELRALVGDADTGLPWPFDPGSEPPMHLAQE